MATQILSVSASANVSSDLTVVSGTPVTVALNGNTGPSALTANNIAAQAAVDIQLKDSANNYFTIDTLHTKYKPALVIYGPGTYRFSRANGQPVGVFSG